MISYILYIYISLISSMVEHYTSNIRILVRIWDKVVSTHIRCINLSCDEASGLCVRGLHFDCRSKGRKAGVRLLHSSSWDHVKSRDTNSKIFSANFYHIS